MSTENWYTIPVFAVYRYHDHGDNIDCWANVYSEKVEKIFTTEEMAREYILARAKVMHLMLEVIELQDAVQRKFAIKGINDDISSNFEKDAYEEVFGQDYDDYDESGWIIKKETLISEHYFQED